LNLKMVERFHLPWLGSAGWFTMIALGLIYEHD
jgi:hypothetical protein